MQFCKKDSSTTMKKTFHQRSIETYKLFCDLLDQGYFTIHIDEDSCYIQRTSSGHKTYRSNAKYQYIEYKDDRILFDKLVALHHFGYIDQVFNIVFKNNNPRDYRKENMDIIYFQQKLNKTVGCVEDIISQDVAYEVRLKYYTRMCSMEDFIKSYNISSYVLYAILNLEVYPDAVPENYEKLKRSGSSRIRVRKRHFTDQEVRLYRELYKQKKISIKEVAYMKNIYRQSAYNMLVGLTYKEIE